MLKTNLNLDLPQRPTRNLDSILAQLVKARSAVPLTLINHLLLHLLTLCEVLGMHSRQSNSASMRSLAQPISHSPYRFPNMETQSKSNTPTRRMRQRALICRPSVLPVRSRSQN